MGKAVYGGAWENFFVSACIRHSIGLCGFNRTSIAEWRTGHGMAPSEIEKWGFMRVCEIAGFMLFGLKAAKSIENTGVFRGDTWWHPVCKKTFGFPWLRAVASLISSFGKTSSHYTWTKGCRFGGCFGKKLCKFAKFFQQSHAIRSCEDSIHHTVRLQPKRISHSLPATWGAKKRHVFSDFLKIFFGVLFLSGQHERLSLMSAMATERIIEKQPA